MCIYVTYCIFSRTIWVFCIVNEIVGGRGRGVGLGRVLQCWEWRWQTNPPFQIKTFE